MKPLLACLALVLLGPVLRAEPEEWTSKDGRTAKLELVRTLEQEGELAGEFRLPNGKLAVIRSSQLSEADAKRLAAAAEPEAAEPEANQDADKPSVFDAAVAKLRAGKKPTDEEKAACNEAFSELYDHYAEKNGIRNNMRWAEEDQMDYYFNAMKMAMIDPRTHGGWPVRSDIRFAVRETLKEKSRTSDDAHLLFCAFFPVFYSPDIEYAIDCYKRLEKADEFLARVTRTWMKDLVQPSPNRTRFMEEVEVE